MSTLFQVLEEHVKNKPSSTAFIFLNRQGRQQERSFKQLFHRVQAIAATLQRTYAAGDRVALMFQPSLNFIEAFIACFAAGLIAVPLQPIQNRRVLPRLINMMDNAGCRALLTDSATRQVLLRIIPDIELQTPTVNWVCTDTIPFESGTTFVPAQVDGSSIAFLQYTSGSTGSPKGVMVTHANLLDNQAQIKTAFEHDETTRFVGWLPVYHDMGLIGNVFQPLYLGIPSVLFSPMDFLMSPVRWLRAISEWKATTSGGPNFAYDLCINRISEEEMQGLDLSSWKIAFNGAEPVRDATIKKFEKKFAAFGFRKEAFYPCYGMAEATLFIAGGSPKSPVIKINTAADALSNNHILETEENGIVLVGCGRTYSNHELKIIEPKTHAVLSDGQIGEIWCQGSSVASGYWGQEKLSEKTFHAFTADGQGPYLRTGDTGFVLRDEIFITGRLKDLIISRGQNHYPDDIEITVCQSNEDFRPSCAAAFTVGEDSDLQLVIAVEVERHMVACLQQDQALRDRLIAKARLRVSEVHGLGLYELIFLRPSTLPKTSSGKTRRSHCRDLYLSSSLNGRIDIKIKQPAAAKMVADALEF